MRPLLDQPEFDVVIIGSGVAGALVGHKLSLAKYRVLILEAGGVAPDSLGRWAMVHNYINSSGKAPDTPFCGDEMLPLDSKNQPADYRYAQPNLITNGDNYYFYDDSDPANKSDRFKSFYERLVGGSTWHWQVSTFGCFRAISGCIHTTVLASTGLLTTMTSSPGT